jgi:hypothetical protein
MHMSRNDHDLLPTTLDFQFEGGTVCDALRV